MEYRKSKGYRKKKRVKISNFKMRPILCWGECSVAILLMPETAIDTPNSTFGVEIPF